MAKLLRHFGLGGKKTPPQQSRQDFCSQLLQPKAQGTDRISGILGEGGHREDLDRRSGCITRSLPLSFGVGADETDPGPRCPAPGPRCPPPTDFPGRSSPVDGLSPAGSSTTEPCFVQDSVSSAPTLRAEQVDEKEPALSGDCSNPCILKEEVEDKDLKAMEACGIEHHPEEDYPVPYELKDLMVTETSDKPKYYDPYASPATMPSASAQSTIDASDFSHYRNLPVITAMMQQSTSGQQSHLDLAFRADEMRVPNENLTAEPADSDGDDDDFENYMDLQEEEIITPRITSERQESETWRTASPGLRSACIDAGMNNYDEPWDLANTRRELEERLRAVQKVESSDQKSSQRQSQSFECVDDRPQEGYDKPWDLQPHMKDDRGQDGYDKPWDLKPHQKDLRPSQEYDIPWDNKVKNIERNLIAAKRAKDAVKGDNIPMASSATPSVPPSAGLQSRLDSSKVADTRPGCDYDEPWDQKKKNLVSKVSDQAIKGAHSPASGSQFQQMTPRNSGVWTKTGGERIDPKVPLQMQTWYHGTISRMDAENLLRVHREGSYLVRTSESNQEDYSLSVKSVRGFMHMKIVKNTEGRYILGQFSQPFLSISQMIYHYTVNKLPIKGADHMSLMYPISNELL